MPLLAEHRLPHTDRTDGTPSGGDGLHSVVDYSRQLGRMRERCHQGHVQRQLLAVNLPHRHRINDSENQRSHHRFGCRITHLVLDSG